MTPLVRSALLTLVMFTLLGYFAPEIERAIDRFWRAHNKWRRELRRRRMNARASAARQE